MENILQFSLDFPKPGPLDLKKLCNGNHSLEKGTVRRLFQKCTLGANICKVLRHLGNQTGQRLWKTSAFLEEYLEDRQDTLLCLK